MIGTARYASLTAHLGELSLFNMKERNNHEKMILRVWDMF